MASRAPQVICCNEAAREVTLYQSVGSKQLGRSFHFDKARASTRIHSLTLSITARCLACSQPERLAAAMLRSACILTTAQTSNRWMSTVLARPPGTESACLASPHQVFAPESGQEKLYLQAIAPIVEEVLEGFNCTIFACAPLAAPAFRACDSSAAPASPSKADTQPLP